MMVQWSTGSMGAQVLEHSGTEQWIRSDLRSNIVKYVGGDTCDDIIEYEHVPCLKPFYILPAQIHSS